MRKELSSLLAGLLRRESPKESSSHGREVACYGLLDQEQAAALSKIVGYEISSMGIYERALTHRSYIQVRSELKLESNERLEFLGDAVLDMIVSDYLFQHHEDLPEGTLSKLKSNIVNKDTLFDCGQMLGLDQLLIISYGAKSAYDNGSKGILADVVEAIIAAVYLDKGYREVEKFVIQRIIPLASGYMSRVSKNYKSRLQEILQAQSKPAPNYSILGRTGPDHKQKFSVQAFVGEQPLGIGVGENKQKAEQDAARNSLNLINIGDQ